MKSIPESRWYIEGAKAKSDGVGITQNPYAEGSPKWYIWNAGWLGVDSN